MYTLCRKPCEHAVDDELVAAGRHAFAVVARAPSARGSVGSSTSCTIGARDLLADAAREQRPALQHRLTVERARQHTEHRTRDERIEDHRDAPARDRLGAEQPASTRSAASRGIASRSRSASVRPADEAVAGLRARAVVGERDRRRRARRAPRVRLDTERVRERGFGRARRRSSRTRRCGPAASAALVARSSSSAMRTFSSVGTAAARRATGRGRAAHAVRRRPGVASAVPLVGFAERRRCRAPRATSRRSTSGSSDPAHA